MDERAIFNEEDAKWYRSSDFPWVNRQGIPTSVAADYMTAFQELYNHPAPLPAVVRGVRRVALA